MPQIFLASSAFRRQAYDLRSTVQAARCHKFSGVQLWLSRDLIGRNAYLRQVRDLAGKHKLKVLVHLPDDFDDDFFEAAGTLLTFQWEKRVIVHFFSGMQMLSWPGVLCGLENAFSGYDESYLNELLRVVAERKTFLTFDLPRLFSLPPARERTVVRFARRVLSRMGKSDVLHLIDFPGFDARRKHWCAFGQGTIGRFAPEIKTFPGAVVLEYEDPAMALKSRKVLAEG